MKKFTLLRVSTRKELKVRKNLIRYRSENIFVADHQNNVHAERTNLLKNLKIDLNLKIFLLLIM